MPKSKNKINIGVIFGSRSVEHEVSIITALQVIHAANQETCYFIPIYIDKQGEWFTGEKLKDIENFKDLNTVTKGLKKVSILPSPSQHYSIESFIGMKKGERLDVIFPLVHGTYGEDGTLQGLIELVGIPYIGSGVLASSIGMDKVFTKKVLAAHQLPVTKYLAFTRAEYKEKSDLILRDIKENLRFPLFVKPSNLGSSVGISKVNSEDEIKFAIKVASEFDSRLLIEEGIENMMEINCSVLGNTENPKPSICEHPISDGDHLSYNDKYGRGPKHLGMKGTRRILPAPISNALTSKIQNMAVKTFQAINCYGIARVDFLLNKKDETIYVNEINTIPGSLSYYLWEASGIQFSQLIDELIGLAMKRKQEKTQTIYSYDSNILKHNFGIKNVS